MKHDGGSLQDSPAQARVRAQLAPAMKLYQFPSYAVIAPDGIQIASPIDRAVGQPDLADHGRRAFFAALAGKPCIGMPFKSDLFLDPKTNRQYPIMTAAAPIRDAKGNVIAVLVLRLDPRSDFTRTAELGRLESTGETYVFDRDGQLLTESRFDFELRDAGLIPAGADSILNLQIRDPGGDTTQDFVSTVPRNEQPLTRMAKRAVAGESGIDLQPYRDYRGVPVVGAWLWDDQLEMGLATEMDAAEAFAPYRRLRNLVLSLLWLTLGVSTGLLIILRYRERLLASNAAFDASLRATEDTMAMVAHDLKNPLNTMMLCSHVLTQLANECGGHACEPIKHHVEMLGRTARHMNHLVSELTDTARIRAGHLQLVRQDCVFQEIIDPVLERNRLLARGNGLEFHELIAAQPIRVSADCERITQVLDNLLGNALKFTPKGGTISFEVRDMEDQLQVSVTDTGPGIPDAALTRIFDPYWQVQATGKSGMGLGLFIARNLIEAHGGKIWVKSLVGHGTTFYFTLPRLPASASNSLPLSNNGPVKYQL